MFVVSLWGYFFYLNNIRIIYVTLIMCGYNYNYNMGSLSFHQVTIFHLTYAMLWHRTESMLVQIMAYYLVALSH